MVAGTSARESVKEMKRLKNEPLLLLVIIAIILFVGIFVIYPVVKVILFPVQRGTGEAYASLFFSMSSRLGKNNMLAGKCRRKIF